MRHTLLVAALLVPFQTTPLTAQDPPLIQSGTRVRITAPPLNLVRHIGTLARLDQDMLVVDTTRVPIRALTRLEFSRGRKSRWLLGMGIGFLAGAGIGAIAGGSMDCGVSFDVEESFCTGLFGAIGAGIGIPVGALVGAAVRLDRWEDVSLDRLRVTASPTPDGRIRLTASLSP